MKQLKIKKISIENFAGLKNQIFEFNGNDARVYGANGTGKTTTATALQWLLFDKGLDGSTKSFNPVPLDENNEEEYELIPIVEVELDDNGKTLKIRKESHPKYTTNKTTNRKEYSRSRTKKQYINDERLKVKDFQSRISELVSEDVFKLITNPAAFNQLHWKEQRTILFEIADDIDTETIIKTNKDFEAIPQILGDHDIETKQKILKDKISQIEKDIKDIPIRINQTESNKQEVPKYDEERYEEIKQEIERLGKERVDVQNGKAEIDLRNQLADKQAELKRLEDNHEANNENRITSLNNEFNVEEGTVSNLKTQIKNNNQQIDYENNRRKTLLDKHKEIQSQIEEVKNRQFEYKDDGVCSCCGQALPADQIEQAKEKALKQFNKNKSQEIEELNNSKERVVNDGKQIKPTIEKLESQNNSLQIRVNEAEDKSQRILNKINQLKASSVNVTQTEEYKSVLNDINEINNKRKDIKTTINDQLVNIDNQITELTQEKVEFENVKAIESSNKHLDDAIRELRMQEDNLLDEKEEYVHQNQVLKAFITTRVKMLTENVNNKFNIAEFKLFNQLVNGELEETCVTTVDGVEYSGGLNNAARINVGLDIINTLSQHYKITAPIFIDNAESITDIIPTEAQQIQLIVSGQDKNLRMETI
ncbi:AAA family ATPase [Staphylococcus epidermidis]|uniref:AAA family ATPase n=1 Tax=Staphylococcus epidermidis TaxID=1282 RepID=UPI00193B82FB|nr:AAA family ATPase [Staphylococcus epidermidis]MBM6127389.1 ATPase [Staphylococcus epidermidis]MBM6134125.1 ATPase [Staphylococcus epidermidis]MBM6136359.1 ATPase [Staphylococcus epidermidis]MBM6141034.1 ATPase [Staphylococcus epidermidis]MBM6143266.1 ATPase [Staphylococcus epidermidis]